MHRHTRADPIHSLKELIMKSNWKLSALALAFVAGGAPWFATKVPSVASPALATGRG